MSRATAPRIGGAMAAWPTTRRTVIRIHQGLLIPNYKWTRRPAARVFRAPLPITPLGHGVRGIGALAGRMAQAAAAMPPPYRRAALPLTVESQCRVRRRWSFAAAALNR